MPIMSRRMLLLILILVLQLEESEEWFFTKKDTALPVKNLAVNENHPNSESKQTRDQPGNDEFENEAITQSPSTGRSTYRVTTLRSPCTVTHDATYGGDYVNCGSRSITRVESRWFPVTATTITLSHNTIGRLYNGTFSHLQHLKKLSISSSGVNTIEVDALKGLTSLEYLNFEDNTLPLSSLSFPRQMFQHTTSLRYLYMGNNRNKDIPGTQPLLYPHFIDIFDILPKLEALSIDAFSHLYIGNEFSKFPNLNSLIIYGDLLATVKNDSFEGLQSLQIKELKLLTFAQYMDVFETAAFQYLNHLDSLTIYGWELGNHKVAEVLGPFIKKNLTYLTLDNTNINIRLSTLYSRFSDGIITKDAAKYLSQICITHFAWTNSKLLAWETEALITPKWMQCLKSLDLSGNQLGLRFGSPSLFLELHKLSVVESITVTDESADENKYAMLNVETCNEEGASPIIKPQLIKRCYENSHTSILTSEESSLTALTPDIVPQEGRDKSTVRVIPAIHDSKFNVGLLNSEQTASGSAHGEATDIRMNRPLDAPILESTLYFFCPKSLKKIRLISITQHTLIQSPGRIISMINCGNLREIYAMGFPKLITALNRVTGLTNLRIFDARYSKLAVPEYFFDDFPNIEILVLRALLERNIPCHRIVRNMTNLRYLDISNNGLDTIPQNSFSNNPLMAHLNLADNRFSTIPVDLKWTPNLRVLDLRRNAIRYLSKENIEAVNSHLQKVASFSLMLDGNGMACVCSNSHFLMWLHSTHVKLDKQRNYTCIISQLGQTTNTAELADMLAFWRQCHGWTWFMVSIVLVLLMLVAFLTTYVTTRFGNAILAHVLWLILPQFRAHTPQDYAKDVFIGYADDDYQFVCYTLTNFLEQDLHLRTFVHQRDLGAGYKDQLFYEAIQNSWRILLVITDNFLYNYDMANIIMKYASYSVSPVNQHRVFVIVKENQLHAIPGYLHAVLDNSRIIIVPDLADRLRYEQKQSIRTCMRPPT